jgi:hypothetical protein
MIAAEQPLPPAASPLIASPLIAAAGIMECSLELLPEIKSEIKAEDFQQQQQLMQQQQQQQLSLTVSSASTPQPQQNCQWVSEAAVVCCWMLCSMYLEEPMVEVSHWLLNENAHLELETCKGQGNRGGKTIWLGQILLVMRHVKKHYWVIDRKGIGCKGK